ncbi:MAG: class I SAM-dependent RNA methyltransferase [Lachnospiraceae bacterium]|nr:class I SAM-dependent RNA methyltransferase [Lachnospiraceae bacterium]
MEYSFGDDRKDGPLTLGLHKKRSFYDVIDVDCCRLVHEDCNRIVKAAGEYFRARGLTYADKRTHLGYLRHLLIRRTVNTREILIDVVTTSQPLIPVEKHADINNTAIYAPESFAGNFAGNAAPVGNAGLFIQEPIRRKGRGRRGSDIEIIPGKVRTAAGTPMLSEAEVMDGFAECLLKLQKEERLEGTIRGILHTYNDSLSDAVKNDSTAVLYGEDHITEELLGLKFRISPFSFFQTNTKGAELLYTKVREFISGELGPEMRVFDLYSGTGTIAQMLAPCVKEVTGVEIVEEAVEAARVNAAANGLSNCRFVADDVLHALDTMEEPDLIILDPPRDGVNPKALQKIIGFGVRSMVYVSCKPESLARDLEMLQYAGYRVIRSAAVDQFPWTDNIETVALLRRED